MLLEVHIGHVQGLQLELKLISGALCNLDSISVEKQKVKSRGQLS